jgi:signal transduction histidine kinase
MSLSRSGRPTASLFAQLLGLVGISIIAAQAINLFMIFNLPPPVPDFYRVSDLAQTIRGAPPEFTGRPLAVKLSDEPPAPLMPERWAAPLRRDLAEHLKVPEDRIVVATTYRNPFSDRRVNRELRDRRAKLGGPDEHFAVAPFEVGVQQADGRWAVVGPRPYVGLDPWQQRVALWFFVSALALAPLAWLFARRLARPIRLFADAAERLGRDPRAPPLSPRGSAEIGVAAKAFNDMQERLRRYVEDRTAMVGAIAHDLRTPLTRLRFRIENAPEEHRAKMAFVRDASRPGERTPLELSSLLESLCDEMAETGADTEVESGDKVVLHGDPIALRRLFTNLLENAVKFGGRARARIFRQDSSAVVEIEDDGPGIPAEDADKVFEPFFRREPSRSRQTGGIGLGLAVVRSIARGHGGDVALTNRMGGGLTARVQLPL